MGERKYMGHTLPVWKEHTLTVLSLAWPNVLTYLIQLLIPLSSSVFVGHLDKPVYLGAATLANMLANASGYSIGLGLAMGLDTLCSQAYGAQKYKLVGLHCQRAIAILTLVCIPVSVVWLQAGHILRLVGIDHETAELSTYYITRLIPGMWPWFVFECLKRYLQCQRINWPPTATVLAVVVLHITNTYALVFYFGWGFGGAAWSTTISNWLMMIFIIFFINARTFVRNRFKLRRSSGKYKVLALQELDGASPAKELKEDISEPTLDVTDDPEDTWPSMWSLNIFRGWVGYLKLGIPASASVFIEWGSFEVNAALSAKLGEIPLATHSILTSTAGLWYTPPVGIGVAASVLVGNMLGAGEPEKARLYFIIAVVLEGVWGLVNGGAGMFYRHIWGRVYTDNDEIVHMVSSMMWVMWLYGLVDALKCIGTGALRGCGRPTITVYGNFLACLVFGYPVAFLLTFVFDMGLAGVWLGMCVAWLVASILYITVLARTDWQKEADTAALRNKESLSTTDASKAILPRVNSDVSIDEEDEEANGEYGVGEKHVYSLHAAVMSENDDSD